MSVTATIAKHPYITGASIIGVGLLFLLLHSAGGSSTSTAAPGVSAPNPNVQIAGIQAGTQLQTQQNAITQQTNQQQYQLTAQAQQLQASLQVASMTAANQASGQQLNYQLGTQDLNNQALKINTDATTQATAIAAQIEGLRISTTAATVQQLNALTTQQNLASISSKTETTLNGQNQQTQQLQITTQGQTAAAQYAAAEAIAANANATSLAISQSANQTQLGLAALQTSQVINGQNVAGQTVINGQNVAGQVATTLSNNQTSVQNNYISTAGNVATAGISAQQQQNQSLINLIQSGALNKGGEGGANQISAIGAVTGYPSIGNAAQATASNTNQSAAGIINGLANLASKIFA